MIKYDITFPDNIIPIEIFRDTFIALYCAFLIWEAPLREKVRRLP